MSVSLSTVLSTTRAYLNDTNQTVWTDAALIPLAQEAHRELQSELWQIGSPLVRSQCAVPNFPISTSSNMISFSSSIGIPPDTTTVLPAGDFSSLGFGVFGAACAIMDLSWAAVTTAPAAMGATTMTVNAVSAFPASAGAMFAIVDPNTPFQETIQIQSSSGVTITFAGYSGTNALIYGHGVGTIITLLPPDLLVPTAVSEYSGSSFYQPMTEVTYFPQTYQRQALSNYWSWQQEHLLVPGATTIRSYLVQYRRQIRIPILNTDVIGVLFGEMYLAPRTAALAAGTLGNGDAYTVMTALAKENFAKVVSANRGQQKPAMKP